MPLERLRATLPAPAVASPIVMVVAAACVIVPVKPVQLSDRQTSVVVPEVVILPVEAASKKTSSAAVGTAAPPAPPEVVAHLVPAVASHVAVPPTQNRLATCLGLHYSCHAAPFSFDAVV